MRNVSITKIIAIIISALQLAVAGSAHAEFIVNGPIKASVRYGVFGVEVGGKTLELSYTQDSAGQKYNPPEKFETVSEYSKRDGMCWVKVGAIEKIRVKFFGFQPGNRGPIEKIVPEYLIFHCTKR